MKRDILGKKEYEGRVRLRKRDNRDTKRKREGKKERKESPFEGCSQQEDYFYIAYNSNDIEYLFSPKSK